MGKSSWPDGIYPRLLREAREEIYGHKEMSLNTF